jgi:hypothetical protein
MAIAGGARPTIQFIITGAMGSSFSAPGMTLVRMAPSRVLTGALRCGARTVVVANSLLGLFECQGRAALHIRADVDEGYEETSTAKRHFTEQIGLYNKQTVS